MKPKDATNNLANKLAIIGTTGTGKTTLAVGLYATSTKTFTVSPIGDETRKYLEIRKTAIEEEPGSWPAATNEAENLDLRLGLHAAGKRTDIVFRDYMGERMERDPNYIRQVIGKPKSAMILFNPGMPGGACKKAAKEFQSIAETLENTNGTAGEGFEPGIVAEQIKSIQSSLSRLVFRRDKSGESSRDALVSECDSISSELESWGQSTAPVSNSGLDRMSHRLRGMASKLDVLKPIGLANPEMRNRMIGNLKKIAQHLKDNRCIAVAFVVTASDRLSSDLKDFREEFEAYASEVTNHLTNLRLNWERFDVTVSGQLEDQNKPKLARGENNTTHEPFLWLLACIKHHEFWRRVKVSAATAAVLLAVAGATFGGLVWKSHRSLSSAETLLGSCLAKLEQAYVTQDETKVRGNAEFLRTNSFDKISALLPSDCERKTSLISRAKDQSELWDIRLLSMEFASASNKLAKTPLLVPLRWFGDFERKANIAAPSFTNAVAERDMLTNEWAMSRNVLETVCQTAHFRDEIAKESKNLAASKGESLVEPLKVSFSLLTDKDKNYSLVTNRSELLAPLFQARTNAIAEYVDSETTWKADDPNPPGDTKDCIRDIRKELKAALSSDEFKNLETIVGQRRNAARIAWETHQFPLRRQAQLDELKGASDSPAIASALKDSLSFLVNMDELFLSIPDASRSSARTTITNARALAISSYIDSQTPWEYNDDDPPSDIKLLLRDARKELKGALTEAEFDSLEDQLTQRRDNARKAWDAYHFPRRASELETELKGAGSNPSRPLRESLAFLGSMTNTYPTISQAEFIKTRTSIEQARKTALADYADSIAKWDVNGRKPPEFDGKKIRDAILTDAVVTDEEASAFDRDMENRFAKANEDWKAVQKDLCDSFIEQKLSSMPDVSETLNAYMDFRETNSRNPFVGSVDSFMTKRLENRIELLVKEYNKEFRSENAVWDVEANRSMRMQKAQKEFNELKRLCLAVTNPMLDGTPVRHSWASKFALLCIEKGGLKESGINSAFQQRFEMSKILVKVDFESTDSTFKGLSLGVSIKSRFWQEGAKDSMSETLVDVNNRSCTVAKKQGGTWYSLWDAPKTFIINPWTDSYFNIYWEDRVGTGFNVNGSFSRNIWSEFRNATEYKDGYLQYTGRFHGEHNGPDTDGTITVRLYGRFTGVDLSMLLQQSQK